MFLHVDSIYTLFIIMNFFKRFSHKSIAHLFGQGFRRFPLAMAFTLFLTGLLIYINHGGTVSNKQEFLLLFYPATGAVLAVALSLLTEDFKSRVWAVIVQCLVHAFWFVVSLYLARFDRFSIPQLIAVSATIAAMSLAVFLICFYRRNQDVPFWNFSICTSMALGVSVAIGVILTLGLNVLVESLKMLFNFDLGDKVFGDIAAVCMVWLAPALFMNLIPKGENKYMTNVVEFSGFAKGVVQYLFIPLLALYMITLYAYAGKILLEWTLPVGGVSYLVSGSMVLMVLLIYITYPVQHQEGNLLFKRVTRWLPVIMMPLLALMTVAIARRLSDYGITVSRLYLLVFNVWCYAVCLWLIFTRNKRIWLIPTSFAVILFLISVGPQSIANITKNHLLDEARTAFTAAGQTEFPLSADQYKAWANKVDNKTAASIDGKLDYLQDFYRYESVKDLIARDVVLGKIAKKDDEKPYGNGYEHYANWKMIQRVEIPAGYHYMDWVEEADIDKVQGELITIVLKPQNGKEQTFELDVKALIALDQDKWQDQTPDPLVLQNGETIFVVNHFTLSVNGRSEVDFLNIDGLLFSK